MTNDFHHRDTENAEILNLLLTKVIPANAGIQDILPLSDSQIHADITDDAD
jgi:hypothetical protein